MKQKVKHLGEKEGGRVRKELPYKKKRQRGSSKGLKATPKKYEISIAL